MKFGDAAAAGSADSVGPAGAASTSVVVDAGALRTCAFCPNPCRSAIPAQMQHQLESQTPSALAWLALQAIEQRVPHDPSIREVLLDLEAAEACRAACVYRFDIASMVRAVAGSMQP